MVSKSWCFTINNSDVFEYDEKSMEYLVYQKERGESGTEHYQGYVHLIKKCRISAMKKVHSTAHWEQARGTATQNKTYCTKEDTRIDGPWEFGTFPVQGKRNDLESAIQTIKASKRKIDDLIEEHPVVFVKYHKGLTKIANHYLQQETVKEFRDVDVQVYWGKSGTGKTRKAVEENEDIYIIRNDSPQLWWDNYTGQTCLIIDEFKNWITLTNLLGLLDGYQCRLPVKGDFTYARWTKVIITSNLHPDEWFPNIDEEHKAALNRRLTKITHFDSL